MRPSENESTLQVLLPAGCRDAGSLGRVGLLKKGPAPDYRIVREKMIQRCLIARGIADERVIEAMRRLPRHLFVDEALRPRAYSDEALPIGSRQTISRPSTVALMSELLALEPDHVVLEIGTGSAYQAAVLSCLVQRVETVERIPALVSRAKRILSELGITNVVVHEGDGTVGLPGLGPHERIIVTAGSPGFLELLFQQLAEGGRMVVPVADEAGGQRLQVVEKVKGQSVVLRSVACSFVPLIGEDGYAPPETR